MSAFSELLAGVDWAAVWEAWRVPLAALAAGGAAGGGLAFYLHGKANAEAVEREGLRTDLLKTRDEVVEALKGLEMEKGKLTEADYAAERQALLAHGAAALRQLDEEFGTGPAEAAAAAAEQVPASFEPGELVLVRGSGNGMEAADGEDPAFAAWVEAIRAGLRAWYVGRGSLVPGGRVLAVVLAPSGRSGVELVAEAALPGEREAVQRIVTRLDPPPVPKQPVGFTHSYGLGGAEIPDPRVATHEGSPVDAALIGALANASRPEPKPETQLISPRWEGALWMLAAIALLGVLYGVLSLGESDPSMGMVRDKPEMGAQAQQDPNAPGPEQQELIARLETNPDDLEALNELSWWLLHTRRWEQAAALNERALKVDASSGDARTVQAVLTYLSGAFDEATAMMESVLADHPEHLKALEYLALFETTRGDAKRAQELAEKALALAPESDKPRLRELVEDAKERANATVVAAGSVEVNAELPENLPVFVVAKTPGAAGMPPLLVKRVVAGEFPMAFKLMSYDRMGGMPKREIPAKVELTVKIDPDGNASTDDGPKSVFEIETGATDLSVKLDATDLAKELGPVVSGAVTWDGEVPDGHQLMVIVRAPGQRMPLLAKNFPARFPALFTLRSTDRMGPMAGPIPDEIEVTAKLVANATDAGPSATVKVARGTDKLKLELAAP